MSQNIQEFTIHWKSSLPQIRSATPDVASAFGGLHAALMKEGGLAVHQKELIALAIGLAQGCMECVYLHAEAALKAGATREQVLEAAGVAVLMGGGPAFVHLPAVIEALNHLAPK